MFNDRGLPSKQRAEIEPLKRAFDNVGLVSLHDKLQTRLARRQGVRDEVAHEDEEHEEQEDDGA